MCRNGVKRGLEHHKARINGPRPHNDSSILTSASVDVFYEVFFCFFIFMGQTLIHAKVPFDFAIFLNSKSLSNHPS